jgi:cytochrome c oxidase cbb3-type subunit III
MERVVVTAVVLSVSVQGCQRDATRDQSPAPPGGRPPDAVRQLDLVAGTARPAIARPNPFAGDAHAVADGRRLYNSMNCGGCHFEGGGGIGPPLMDDDWIYGGRPEQIFDSIASGRANGMPAYGDRLSADQTWRIVAYVETLSEDADDRRREGAPEREGEDDR